MSVLVVDDEAAVREVVAWMLEDAGCDVHEAAGGREALSFLSDFGPVDLVISDINMPEMDGLELSACARRRWPDQPVLLISGRPQPCGVHPFIPKPFRWETLVNAITNLAGGGWRAQSLAD